MKVHMKNVYMKNKYEIKVSAQDRFTRVRCVSFSIHTNNRIKVTLLASGPTLPYPTLPYPFR